MHPTENVRPFKLVKYFAYSSLFLLFLAFLILAFIVSKGAKALILEKNKEYAFLVAENLNHQVFLQFTLPTVILFGHIRLREKAQFNRLDLIVRNTIHGFNIEQVNIYDLKGTIAYSTSPGLVGKKVVVTPEFQLAKRGIIASRLEKTKLKTYAPFRAEKAPAQMINLVLGIFEITQDLSKDYQTIRHFELTVGISAITIMSLLFLGLTLIVKRAEKIIAVRAEEQRRLENRLRQAEHLATLGQMIAAVSHEIRNPLGVISSTAELLYKREKNNPTNAQMAQIIVEEVRRLNRILTEFLEFARPQIPKPTSCNITGVIDKVLTFLKPDLEDKNIEVIKDYRSLPFIEADSELLYRAFLNIVINAIQALSPGGEIRVTVDENQQKKGVTIIFSDNGPGVPEEILSQVFNPFFTTKEKGSGLGLPIVKNIIENHGGEVKIESEEGKGTRVIIFLPK